MGARLYIWISRWQEFQHYKPERDRAPAWIKNYTKQLDDEAYLGLTAHQRGILGDLRAAFARTHGRLSADTRQLTHRLHVRVTSAQLEALNHAGFIEFVSREHLEHRLEQLYSSPRARVEGEREEDRETRAVFVPRTVDAPEAETNGPGDLSIRQQIADSLASAKAAGGRS